MLLSLLAVDFGVVISRAIGAPGHGKDLVDGLNATDKIYLRKKMCMIGTPEAKDSKCRMAAHSMVGDAKMSLAVESKRLCEDPSRAGGVKSEGGKRHKREEAAKMKHRFYHVQDPKDVEFADVKRTTVGLQQIELPWKPGVDADKQPRFASSTGCDFYAHVFSEGPGKPGLNDWKIVTLEPTKEEAPEVEERAYAVALAGITTMMAEQIEIGKFGAFSTLDEDADGYYVIKFTSEAYTLQDEMVLEMYDPPIHIPAGSLV